VNLFDVLGTQAQKGRLFGVADGEPSRNAVAVVSYAFWLRNFGGSADVIGQTLRLGSAPSSQSVQIVGVLPESFDYPPDIRPDVLIPLGAWLTPGKSSRYLTLVARLVDGVSLEAVRGEVSALSVLPMGDPPASEGDRATDIVQLQEAFLGDVSSWMFLAMWTAALVIATSSVAAGGLLLARTTDRSGELALRACLGATPRRLWASLLVEGPILALAACLVGLPLAHLGIGAARAAIPDWIPRANSIAMNLRVVAFAVATSMAVGFASVALPATQVARIAPGPQAQSRSNATVPKRLARLRSVVVIAVLASVSALLVVSSLFTISFRRYLDLELGFTRGGLAAVELDGLGQRMPTIVSLIESRAGTVSVAYSSGAPPLLRRAYGGYTRSASVQRVDASETGSANTAVVLPVSSRYFETMRIAVREGRPFAAADAGTPVAILDHLAATLIFGKDEAVGGRIRIGQDNTTALSVVAVVDTVRSEGPLGYETAHVYVPQTAAPSHLLFRVSDTSAFGSIRRDLEKAAQGSSVPRIVTFDDAFIELTTAQRSVASAMGFAGLAILAVGGCTVFAALMWSIRRERPSLAIRMALGATPGKIRIAILLGVCRLAAIGLAIGLPLGCALGRIVGALVPNMSGSDPVTYGFVAALVLATALASALLPMERATRTHTAALLTGRV
jgi:predicted permease